MLLLDAFFRFTAVGLIAFHVIITWRDVSRSQSSFYFMLASLTLLASLLSFTPEAFHLPYYLRMSLRFIDVPQLIFFWLLALSLFQKDFKVNGFHLLVGLAFCVPVFAERLLQFGLINHLPAWQGYWINITALAIMVHMIAVTLGQRSDDLIKTRRKTRLGFVFLIALVIFLIVAISFTLPQIGLAHHQHTANMLAIWPVIMFVSYWMFSIRSTIFSFDTNKEHLNLDKKSDKELNFRDSELLKKLDTAINTDKVYLEIGLSIPVLASKLGVSKYRLRDFINQILGYDNFSSYINTFRIDSIKKDFANPEKKHIPILTIALDNGFNSLSPFNRAFKSIVGVTPTQYRKNTEDQQIN